MSSKRQEGSQHVEAGLVEALSKTQLEVAAADETYSYAPFEDGNSIRILTLQPGAPDSPLVGDLSIENLDSEPVYEAISYVWGNAPRATQMTCSGRSLPITQSVHDAVARMRPPLDGSSSPRRLWVDQICINQEDVGERSRQVRLMNAVYKGAEQVLVWLGRDDDGVAADAARTVEFLDDVFADEEKHEVFLKAYSEDLARQSQMPWVPLSKLSRLPWFQRIWIIQEIGTAAPATLFWGATTSLPWETLSRVSAILNERYHHLRTRFAIGTPNIRYLYRRFVEPLEDFDDSHNRGNFVYELHRARHLLSRDPRDHVYAFLGHFSLTAGGNEGLAGLEADYGREVADVYLDVAIRELRGSKSLILLSAKHNSPARDTGSNGNAKGPGNRVKQPQPEHQDITLPSWVPDWRVLPVHIMGCPETPHRAAGYTAPSLDIDERERVLHIRGVRVDTIARRSWVFYGKAFQFRRDLHRRQPLQSLWMDVCRYRSFTLDEKYNPGVTAGETIPTVNPNSSTSSNAGSTPSSEPDTDPDTSSAFYALIQTLTNNCIGLDRTRQHNTIPRHEFLSHGAAYLVRSGIPTALISPALRQLARGGDAFSWSHRATLVTRYRRFGVSAEGYYVMGPEDMEIGDVVVVLRGGRTPFVLRERMGDEHGGGGWDLVGECYVHGLMNGEALEREGVEEEVFSIK